jgi:hypothetical protein
MIFSHTTVSSILVIALTLELIIITDASPASKGPEYLLAEKSENVYVDLFITFRGSQVMEI